MTQIVDTIFSQWFLVVPSGVVLAILGITALHALVFTLVDRWL